MKSRKPKEGSIIHKVHCPEHVHWEWQCAYSYVTQVHTAVQSEICIHVLLITELIR